MRKTIKLGARVIGEGVPVFVVAEAGVNHNGDPELALELVRQAKKSGADCVKFQTFKAETVMTQNAPKAAYQLKVTDPQESQFEMLKKLELPTDAYRRIIALSQELNIQFLSTPYDFSDVNFLNDLDVGAFKIASGQLVELPFLTYAAKFGKPIILSTGMATFEEIKEAVEAIRRTGNDQLILLQCTTHYPSVVEEANLRAIETMKQKLGVLIGYSDHTESPFSAFAAAAMGAVVIEKHFTLDRYLPGPDQACSLEPVEFAGLVRGIREIEKALGDSEKKPTAAELKNLIAMRRSLATVEDILPGDPIERKHLAFKRPATGLSPNRMEEVIGKRAKKKIPADTILTEEFIEW